MSHPPFQQMGQMNLNDPRQQIPPRGQTNMGQPQMGQPQMNGAPRQPQMGQPQMNAPSRQPQMSQPQMNGAPRQPQMNGAHRQPHMSQPHMSQPQMNAPPRQPQMNAPPRQPQMSQPQMNSAPRQPQMSQPRMNTPPRQPQMSQPQMNAPPRQPQMSQPQMNAPPRQPQMSQPQMSQPQVNAPPRQPQIGQPQMNAPPRQPQMGQPQMNAPPRQPQMNGPPRQQQMGQPQMMQQRHPVNGMQQTPMANQSQAPHPPRGMMNQPGGGMMNQPGGGMMNQPGGGMMNQPGGGMMNQPGIGMMNQPGGGMMNQPGVGMMNQPGGGMMNQRTNIDPNSMCDPIWMQPSFTQFPASGSIATQSGIPLGVVLQPLADHPQGKEPPVVNFGSVGVVRCDKCRAYINPFVQWLDNGRRWRCNICGRDNNTSPQYYNHLDASGNRVDKMEKAELNQGCIEIVAPHEYMLRPPQAPVFMFVIDVSFESISTGVVASAVEAIRSCLDRLPGSPRTHVGLLTFDYAVHYYSLNSKLSQPKMFVVSDLDECFIPCPEDLLVNLQDSRESFDMLLESLPRIHAKNSSHEVAAGSAIQSAFKLMSHIGGRMMVFQSKMSTLGAGKLEQRDTTRILGTDKEHTAFKSVSEAITKFYRADTVEMSKFQVCVELFVFASGYCDLATLQQQCRYSGGQCHYYPRFNANVHGSGLIEDIERSLTRETSWEGVFRLRASNGIKVSPFFGNFFVRGADLMQLPNCDADATFGIGIAHTDQALQGESLTLQAALLYTNSNGQRRIRVMTSCYPLATNAGDVIKSGNLDPLCNYLSKAATSTVAEKGFEEGRASLLKSCVDLIRANKMSCGRTSYGAPAQQQQPQLLPPNLALLPLYIMALQKNPAFRGGNEVGIDERAYLHHLINRMPIGVSSRFIYPRMYEIDTMTPDCGRPVAVISGAGDDPDFLSFGKNQRIKLPKSLSLTISNLRSNGMFLVDNGIGLHLWVGRAVDKRLLHSVFGIPVLDGIDSGVLRVEAEGDDNDFKQRFCQILKGLRQREKGGTYMQLNVFKEGDPIEAKFRWFFVEDRAAFNGGSFSYPEFLNHCQRMAG